MESGGGDEVGAERRAEGEEDSICHVVSFMKIEGEKKLHLIEMDMSLSTIFTMRISSASL